MAFFSRVAQLITVEVVVFIILLQTGSKYCTMFFCFVFFPITLGRRMQNGKHEGKEDKNSPIFYLKSDFSAVVGYWVSLQSFC